MNPSQLITDPLHQVASVGIFCFLILNCGEMAKQSAYSFAAILLDIEVVLQHGGRPYDVIKNYVTARGLYRSLHVLYMCYAQYMHRSTR